MPGGTRRIAIDLQSNLIVSAECLQLVVELLASLQCVGLRQSLLAENFDDRILLVGQMAKGTMVLAVLSVDPAHGIHVEVDGQKHPLSHVPV